MTPYHNIPKDTWGDVAVVLAHSKGLYGDDFLLNVKSPDVFLNLMQDTILDMQAGKTKDVDTGFDLTAMLIATNIEYSEWLKLREFIA